MEPKLQGSGHLSGLGEQVMQSAIRSLNPQVVPLHKTMSTQTEPPCVGKGCTCMLCGSLTRLRLHLHGDWPSKKMQRVSTQEEAPQRKEDCATKGQDCRDTSRIYTEPSSARRGKQNKCRTAPTLKTQAIPIPGLWLF